MNARKTDTSARRERLRRQFQQHAAREYRAASSEETYIIDTMNDGDLRPLSRYLWKHGTLTPRLAFFVGLLIRDPADLSTTKLLIVDKVPAPGRPTQGSDLDRTLEDRRIADFRAENETGGRGGAKIGISLAAEKFELSTSTVKRRTASYMIAARNRATRNGPTNQE